MSDGCLPTMDAPCEGGAGNADAMALENFRRRDAARIAHLEAQVSAQASLIRKQEASFAHSCTLFARASEAARIGVWECTLGEERLQWTDAVYDIFDIPRGAALERNRILECYPENSRKTLERVRSRAIASCSGFTLDAEITTPKGRSRWIRITASFEGGYGRTGRIFGMKQDITEEKILWDQMRHLAEFDAMTGLANRGQFEARLAELGRGPRRAGALVLVDLDRFKAVNDTLGHAVGDECLKEVALRLGRACRRADLVARIGGDEFGILLGPRFDRPAIQHLAGRIVAALGRPVERCGHSFELGASVGIARFEDCDPSDLFKRADAALYSAKAAGGNTFRMFGSMALER